MASALEITGKHEELPVFRALVRVAAVARTLNDDLPAYVEREPLRQALAQLDLETGSGR